MNNLNPKKILKKYSRNSQPHKSEILNNYLMKETMKMNNYVPPFQTKKITKK